MGLFDIFKGQASRDAETFNRLLQRVVMPHAPDTFPGMSDKVVAAYACALFARNIAEDAGTIDKTTLLLAIAGSAAGCAGPLRCRWEELAGGALGLMFGVNTPERHAMADALNELVREARDTSPVTLKNMIATFGAWLDCGGRIASAESAREMLGRG